MTALLAAARLDLAVEESWRLHAACRRRSALFEGAFDEGSARPLLAVGLHICRTHCTVLDHCERLRQRHLGEWADVVIAGTWYSTRGEPRRSRPSPSCATCKETP